ncbi:hypothetical protein M378DRAFT_471729 [Amanita muscaria Koide BX008]|uniref:Uncharacterized protein n=1 Tax=Amanita muscaria (strain Koide BX008) TaxID=946122 RepID=A0A0C2TTF1_AMAMK|nr:hypothetical protein M378DRAFT_471729 [Amanita muscaria Koide BX008]
MWCTRWFLPPLSAPWSENITTFSEALNASLPTNYSQPLPTVIRAVDRCWCDLSAGSFFEPFNVSRWEHLSVARLKNELERPNRAAPELNATLLSNTTESAANATQIPVESSVVNAHSQHTWSQFTNWLLHRRRVAERRNDVMEEGPVKEAESWLRKEYDLRPQGFDVILDFSW